MFLARAKARKKDFYILMAEKTDSYIAVTELS